MELLLLFLFFADIILRILNFAVFARVILSWFPHMQLHSNRIYLFLYDITEPLFRMVQVLPHRIGMIDISALYVFVLLQIMMTLVAFISL